MKTVGLMRRSWGVAFAAITLCACGGKGGAISGADGGAPTRVDAGVPPPAEKCATNVPDGGVSFRDVTDAWGMGDVRAGRVSVADLDGDGFPDVVVHKIGNHNRADFTKPAKDWPYRVLMNRPKDGGGRTFVDQTRESGFATPRENATDANVGRSAQFAVFADLNDDGHVDIFSGTYSDRAHPETDPGDRSEVLLGDGAGRFVLAPFSEAIAESADGALATPVTSAAFLDDDRDGLLDLYIGHFYGSGLAGVQNRLVRNEGEGAFVDVTDERGLTTPGRMSDRSDLSRPTYGVTTCDVDGDGRTDILVSAYGRQWNQMYVRGDDAFRDVARASGFAGDSNVDFGDNEFYKCYCQTSGRCTAAAPRITCDAQYWSAGVDDKPFRLNGNTFTTACGDVNNDGRMDLFSAEIAHWHIGRSSDTAELLVNEGGTSGEPRFSRPGRPATGLAVPRVGTSWNEGGISSAIADVNNDGRPDILLATSDYPDQFLWMFLQKVDGTFEEASERSGVRHACAPAFALADIDRDGDLDLIVTSSTARDCRTKWPDGPAVKVYENTSAQDANWTQLHLEGKGAAAGGANRSAIGALVKVVAGGVTQTREVQGGYGHFGLQHDLDVTVGLGASCAIDSIEVTWPNAQRTVERFENVRANYRLIVREGEGLAYRR
jgi:hypothetical protein